MAGERISAAAMTANMKYHTLPNAFEVSKPPYMIADRNASS